MSKASYIKVYLSASTLDRFKSLAEKYGFTSSALGSLVVIKFMQDKPEDLKQFVLEIDPAELSIQD